MARESNSEALALLQDYEKNASYLCSPDQTLLKAAHFYLLAKARYALGLPGVISLCEQALGLAERSGRAEHYGAMAVGLNIQLSYLRARVLMKNASADSKQHDKAIAALRFIIQEQMAQWRRTRAKNIRGQRRNPQIEKLLERLCEGFSLMEVKGLYAEALMMEGKYEQAGKLYEGLVKEKEAEDLDERGVNELLNFTNQLGNCYSRLRRY